MSKFSPELELQFRLLENTIIKQNLNYFRKRKNFETVYEDQILEQIELEQNRLKREKIFFNVIILFALILFIIAMLVIIDIALENKIYNFLFMNNLLPFYPNNAYPQVWT